MSAAAERSDGASTPGKAAVVGAGLAGLACAAQLTSAGWEVDVFEASDAVGGRVRTDTIDGYRVDRGFQVLLTAYPEAHRQLDLDALHLCPFDPGARIQMGPRASVVADPFRSPSTVLATLRSPAVALLDKPRMAWLRHQLRTAHPAALLGGTDTTTLESLTERGFDRRTIERFFTPLVGGIQLDPDLSTSRRMFDVIFRMLADGDSVVPAAGMQAIPEQLAKRLADGALHLGQRVESVAPGRVRTADVEHTADAVIVACEGPAAARLLDLPDPGSRAAGAVWFASEQPPIDDRLVVLDGHGGPVLNAAVMTNVAPSYAPAGRALTVAALPGRADGDIEAAARTTLRSWWGATVDEWETVAVQRIAHGQPDQSPPFSPKQPVALGDGLFVCGDHRDTGSIQGALYSGRRCAAAVIATSAAAELF